MSGAERNDIADQSEVVALMRDPHTHADASPVQHLETHGAHVFLAGDLAYKVKRAVDLPFLDYSTPAKRLAMLARELEINRRFAPGLYLGIVAITRGADGQLRLAGDGPPIEYALMMRRFDQAALLSEVVRREPRDADLPARLAAAVAASHAAAPAGPAGGGAARVEATIAQVCAGLERLATLLGPDAVAIRARASDSLARTRTVLDARAAAGHVRRCHGDLHLGNIVVLDGVPTPFDALEFDEDLATTDTLYDLAFLVMDLEAHAMAGLACVVRDAYLRVRAYEDIDGLRALPLFLALRSAVRGVVHAERARQSGAAGDVERARRYVRDSADLLVSPPPRLIAIGGLSGTGKTTLARALCPRFAPRPGAIHLRSDVERKAMLGRGEFERLDEAAYAPSVTKAVYERLGDLAGRALAAGQSVVVDAVFSRDDERDAIASVAARAGVRFDGIWLVASPPTMMARVAARHGDASDATVEVVRAQVDRGTGPVSWMPMNASGDRAEVLDRATAHLTRRAAAAT